MTDEPQIKHYTPNPYGRGACGKMFGSMTSHPSDVTCPDCLTVLAPQRVVRLQTTEFSVYISGPMTGYPEFNYPAFNRAEYRIRLARPDVRILNPAAHPKQTRWEDFLRLDLQDVLMAHTIITLPGWQESRGASLEVHVAHELRIPVLPLNIFLESGGVRSTSCPAHHPVQHRDGKPPWCDRCGSADGQSQS